MTRWLAAANLAQPRAERNRDSDADGFSSFMSFRQKGGVTVAGEGDAVSERPEPPSEAFLSFVSFCHEGVEAAVGAVSPNADGTTSPAEGVSSVSSVLSEGSNGISPASRDKNPRDLRRDLNLDPRPRPDDAEVYARALTLHGPMTYGTAMRVLGWGATRAGQAEAALREAGRIIFNSMGRAVLVEEAGKAEPSGESA